MSAPDEPCVAVWRDVWLADTETFVRDQVRALGRWRPFLVGLRRRENVLGVVPDAAPLTSGRLATLRTQVLGSLGMRGTLVSALERSGASLVHAHFGTSAVQALPVARRAGLPLVATFHGYDVTSPPGVGFGLGREYRSRLREVFDYASRLVAVSEFIAERLVALGAPEDRVVVRHIGIDLSASRGPLPELASRSGVCFVGRLVRKKGVDHLIEAFARLPEELRSGTRLRIAGDGPERANLERLAAERGVRAEFLGHSSPERVRELFRESEVLAAPSLTAPNGDAEGFGMVFLEAAALGTPSVAYAHGGVREAVVDGRTGLLAPEGDVAALTANLQRLLTDRALAEQLGLQGRDRTLGEFDILDRTAELEKLYDEVAASARR